MLNPPYVRNITTRRTAFSEWREPSVGDVFQVGSRSYQTVAILPVNAAQHRYRAQMQVRRLGSAVTFLEPLDRLWAMWDACSTRGGWAVRFEPCSLERARRKQTKKNLKFFRYWLRHCEAVCIA